MKCERRKKIKMRIRKSVSGTLEMPRLSVYKSNRCVYAQLVDDERGHTLVASSSKMLGKKGISVDNARYVGEDIASKAIAKGVEEIVFDRSGYIYHGRIKALAEAARAKGLKF